MAIELIETIEVGAGGAASIEFTSIPQDGVDLLLVVSVRTSGGGGFLTINGGLFYTGFASKYLSGDGGSASSASATNAQIISSGSTTTANTFGNGQVLISNYTSTTNKSISIDSVTENNATTAYQRITASSYSTSSAVTSLGLTNQTFDQYSTASLYKIY